MGLRLNRGVIRGKEIEFYVNGRLIIAYEGETIGTALIAAGHWPCQLDAQTGQAMGIFCNVGACHSCVMTVNGKRNVRVCVTPVTPGLRVETQKR
jgi:hypothetical protein